MATRYEHLRQEEPEEQEEPEKPEKPEFRMVLFGKTGVRKSAAGNIILANTNAFELTSSEFQKETGEFDSKILTVVVTPDLFGTRADVEVWRELHRCICFAAPGPHVFLVVFQAYTFTQEDQEILRKIHVFLGEAAAHYSMVLFISGDNQEPNRVSFDEFISENLALSDFIRQCGGYHVFNQGDNNPTQVRELLEKINTKVQRNGGCYYTNHMLKEADFRMVLVGKTGVGKSTAGNTILGERVFKATPSSSAVTKKNQMNVGQFDGKFLSVVDTPGLFGLNKTEEEMKQEFNRCVSFAAPGPHGFLVVIQANRFTEQEQQSVRIIQEMFGEKAAGYTMVLFTCGDNLEADGVTIEDVIHDNKVLNDFIRQCGGRYHVFNNRNQDPSQVKELLEKIHTMVQRNGGSYYTNEMFRKAGRALSNVEPDLRIVLVGKTRVGKSAAGNTILRGEVFTTSSSFSSVTSECQKETALFDFKLLAVVDTPGLFHTELTILKVKKEIARFISFAAPGPHVFLIVTNQNDCTKEEYEETVKIIKKMFGEEAAGYTMVLFTHGDEQEVTRENALSCIDEQCGGGYHFFNNKVRDPSQVRELLEKINTMVQRNGGSYYTNDMFKKAEKAIKEKMERLKKEKNMIPQEVRHKAERNNKFIKDRRIAIFIGTVLGLGAGVGTGIGIEAGIGAAAGAPFGLVGSVAGAGIGTLLGLLMGIAVYF